MRTRKRKPVEERFWSKIRIGNPDECWEWQGAKRRDGYGEFTINIYGKWTVRAAHRVAFYFSRGEWPIMHVCHSCDNPPCCNPAHLWEGTNQENGLDMARKHRSAFQQHPESVPRGEKSGTAKLTDEQVLEIRASYMPWKMSADRLAKRYNVNKTTIWHILRRESWKHI